MLVIRRFLAVLLLSVWACSQTKPQGKGNIANYLGF
jgi:hypothetical protein